MTTRGTFYKGGQAYMVAGPDPGAQFISGNGGGGGGGPTVPSYVQTVCGFQGSTTTVVIPVGQNTSASNALLLFARGSSGRQITAVTDTQGNTWQKDVGAGATLTINAWSSPNTNHLTLTGNAGNPDTITVTYAGSVTAGISVYEYSGLLKPIAVDTFVAVAGTTGTSVPFGPTAATVDPEEMSIAAIGWNTTETGAITPDAAWTLRDSGQSTAASGAVQVAEKLLPTAGATPSITWTLPVSSGSVGSIVNYRSV